MSSKGKRSAPAPVPTKKTEQKKPVSKKEEKNNHNNDDNNNNDLMDEEAANELTEKLNDIENRIDVVRSDFESKQKQLEQHYRSSLLPLQIERHQLLSALPQFWRVVFSKCPKINELCGELDEKLLDYLISINAKEEEEIIKKEKEEDEEEEEEDGEGEETIMKETIIFHFKTNPFFSNKTLSKTYTYKAPMPSIDENGEEIMDDDDDQEPDIINVECDKIDWKIKAAEVKNNAKKSFFIRFFDQESDISYLPEAHTIRDLMADDPFILYQADEDDEDDDDALIGEGEDDDDNNDDDEEEEEQPAKKKAKTTTTGNNKKKKAQQDDDEDAPTLV